MTKRYISELNAADRTKDVNDSSFTIACGDVPEKKTGSTYWLWETWEAQCFWDCVSLEERRREQ